MENIKLVNRRLLRYGYTTGSCAAAAAKAAAYMLLTGEHIHCTSLKTPNGTILTLDIFDAQLSSDSACCAVKKDSGDDPDVTNGILVYAHVSKTSQDILIDGGKGVGRVTKPGLDQPVGAAAINSTPRRMIAGAVREVCEQLGYSGGIAVTISIPEGEALAKRTFNPRMGIEGGISVIGTTGIVEPMSNQALVETIKLELRQLRSTGTAKVLLTPGNYGERFITDTLKLSSRPVLCSNFIGETMDYAIELGFSHILLVGHIGTLGKLGIGGTNTHSAFGDGRMETLAVCALEAGAGIPLLKGILGCVTADGALELIHNNGLLPETMAVLGQRIEACLDRRIPDGITWGYVMFTNAGKYAGVLSQSPNAQELMKFWR